MATGTLQGFVNSVVPHNVRRVLEEFGLTEKDIEIDRVKRVISVTAELSPGKLIEVSAALDDVLGEWGV